MKEGREKMEREREKASGKQKKRGGFSSTIFGGRKGGLEKMSPGFDSDRVSKLFFVFCSLATFLLSFCFLLFCPLERQVGAVEDGKIFFFSFFFPSKTPSFNLI